MERAERYGAARDRLIVGGDDVLEGTPAIKSTRVSVYAIRARVQDGDTVEDTPADYPALTREAVEAAVIAATHQLVVRPGGRP